MKHKRLQLVQVFLWDIESDAGWVDYDRKKHHAEIVSSLEV